MIRSDLLETLARAFARSLTFDSLRYFIPVSLAFVVFSLWGAERFAPRRLQPHPRAAAMLHDLRWSLSTILIFALVGVGVQLGRDRGVLRDLPTVADAGWVWFFASVVVLAVLQDAWFYWTHRAMHHRLLFKHVHRIHHVSSNPSPWTAYAFAPLEALTHAAFVPLVWLVLPLHQLSVFLFLIGMILRNVLGHLSIELMPPGFTRSPFWGWITTTTHHDLHHQRASSNFGLYFTFWDRLMGTINPTYHPTFERVAGAPR